MALKTPVIDRVPTYPGRVQLTPVSGQTNIYDMVRADQPIEEGTPLNKALFDQRAYTLTETVTVYVNGSTGSDVTGAGTSVAPYATIQKAIDSIPKCLGGFQATVDIAAGTYAERVRIDGFYGGRLNLGVSGRTVTIHGLTIFSSATVRTYITNITYSANFAGSMLEVANGSNVTLVSGVTFDGDSSTVSGLVVSNGSIVTAYNTTLVFLNMGGTAVFVNTGSKATLEIVNGTTNNTSYGLRSERGGLITYVTKGMTNTRGDITNGGGRILTGGGTALANASVV